MERFIKAFLATLSILVLIATSTLPAEANLPVIDVTAITKDIELATTTWAKMYDELMTAKNILAQAQSEAQSLNTGLTNPSDLWAKTSGALATLGSFAQQYQTVAYAFGNIDQQFQQVFPGYKPDDDFSELYATLNTNTQNAIVASMRVLNEQNSEFADENSRLGGISTTTTSGTMQAIQQATVVDSMMIEQMQKLRQLMMTQIQMEGQYYFQQSRKSDATVAAPRDAMVEWLGGQDRFASPPASP